MSNSQPCTIAPWLSVSKSAEAVDFYKSAFGATEAFRLDGSDGSVVAADDPGPSNMSVIEQSQMLVSVRAESHATNGFWLWMAADNLRLSARNASACAMELIAL